MGRGVFPIAIVTTLCYFLSLRPHRIIQKILVGKTYAVFQFGFVSLAVVLFSWVIALAEYSCQVPANRIGFLGNGGPFSLMQLKVIQEVITLIIFTVFTTVLFKGETLHWNHFAAFVCLVLAVYFVFYK